MRRTRLLLLPLLTLALASCTAHKQALPQDSAPLGATPDYGGSDLPGTLDFSIKNATDDALVVHYFYGKLYVTDTREGKTVAYKVTPSAAEWESFWKAMDSVALWEWSSSVDPGEPDFWSLEHFK